MLNAVPIALNDAHRLGNSAMVEGKTPQYERSFELEFQTVSLILLILKDLSECRSARIYAAINF